MAGLFSADSWAKVWTYRSTFLLGFGNTMRTAFFALLLALTLGVLFGLMATSGKKLLAAIARVYVEIIQNTPVLLQMCFLYYVLAFSGVNADIIVTGVVVLGVYTGAYMSEVVRAGIQASRKDSLRRRPVRDLATRPPCIISFCPRASRSSCRPWSTRWSI